MVDMLPVPGPGHEFPAAGVRHLGHAKGPGLGTDAPGPLDGALEVSLATRRLTWRRLGSWWSMICSSSVMCTAWMFSLGLPALSASCSLDL